MLHRFTPLSLHSRQEMLCRSVTDPRVLHFGMAVANSFFQIPGQISVLVISLWIFVKGITNRSLYSDMRKGKMSLMTIDFGFLKACIFPAT